MKPSRPRSLRLTALALAAALVACHAGPRTVPAPPPPEGPAPGGAPSVEATPAPEASLTPDEPLPVEKSPEPLTVTAWAEPSHLPPGGGQAQILVRVRKKGDGPLAGVEVRLRAAEGQLYSAGKTLTTDPSGMTRDRLTARKEATVIVNAGGTVIRVRVPLAELGARPEH